MREQKTMRKGTFFELGSAQRCHHEGMKNAIFVGKGYVFFTSLLERGDKGCLVVTELRKKPQYFSYVYCISAIYKGC